MDEGIDVNAPTVVAAETPTLTQRQIRTMHKHLEKHRNAKEELTYHSMCGKIHEVYDSEAEIKSHCHLFLAGKYGCTPRHNSGGLFAINDLAREDLRTGAN